MDATHPLLRLRAPVAGAEATTPRSRAADDLDEARARPAAQAESRRPHRLGGRQRTRRRASRRVDVVSYDGNTDALREVETGKLDATLQDTPIADVLRPALSRACARVGAPVGRGYYVIYVRKGTTALRDGARTRR